MTEKKQKIWTAGTLTYTAGGLILLAVWLLGGDFPWSMRDRAVNPAATIFIKQIGVSDFMYGLIVISFPNFTNIFLSPVISYISDRHRGKYGRRIPFLMFTTPFIVAGLAGLGLTRYFGELLHSAIPSLPLHHTMLIFFCIAWVLLDFGTTLSNSLFYALINDVVPEELLGRFFSLLRIVSLAAGVIFNFWLLDKAATHGAVIFLGLSLLYGAGLTLLCCKVKEGQYPPPPPEPPELQNCSTCERVMHGVSSYFRQSFSMPYYRWFMVAVAMSASLAFGPVNYFAIQYAQSISYSMKAYGICLVISLTASLCLSYPLGWIADRFHPLRTGMYSLGLYLILMIVSYPLMSRPELFGTLFTLHCLISGIYTTLTASLMPRLLPRSLFAQFSSAGAIVGAGFNMIAAPLFGWLIDSFSGGYRILFILGGIGTLATLAAFLPVCRGFRQYGGYSDYHAPEPE